MVHHHFLLMRKNGESCPKEILASSLDRCYEGSRFNTFGTHTQRHTQTLQDCCDTLIIILPSNQQLKLINEVIFSYVYSSNSPIPSIHILH